GASTAIGRTPDVGGHIEFASTSVVSARVDADLTTLVSDDPRRDRRVQSMLGPDAQASFVLNDVIDPGEVPRIGEIIELDVDGTLTIRDISRPVEARVQVGVIERGMVVTGSLSIALDDFDLEVPSAAIVLSASEEATIEWQLFFARDAS
ncbi:MAG: YceI family protein, partial [Nitriliruptoraceae bacterium]